MAGKRDPSSHRTPAQIRKQVKGYNHKPEMIAKRNLNNQARAKMLKAGKVEKGDNKDVGHKTPLRLGGGNGPENLEVQSEKFNRGWRGGGKNR